MLAIISSSYVTGELQIQAITRYDYTPIRVTKIQKEISVPNGGEVVDSSSRSLLWGMQFGKQFGDLLQS